MQLHSSLPTMPTGTGLVRTHPSLACWPMPQVLGKVHVLSRSEELLEATGKAKSPSNPKTLGLLAVLSL